MTQIISYANRNFALQVGDRLVSERRPRQPISPRDPLFNKHVLFLAKDAIVSIGFAGLAYVTGVPTDQWIASVLYGKPLPGPKAAPVGGLESAPMLVVEYSKHSGLTSDVLLRGSKRPATTYI